MSNTSANNITKKCKEIIKNNSPQKSIDIISNIINPVDKNKFGPENALKIYKVLSDDSEEYDINKYKNNINKYKNNVNNNINKASKHAKNNCIN